MAFKTTDKTNQFIRSLICEDKCLANIVLYAEKNNIPIILPESAAFFKQLCILKKPKTVLEVGMGIGYSGHIILLNTDADLCSIELNEKSKNVAYEFFSLSKLLNRVNILFGDESEIIPLLDKKFDMIFLDGAKTRYLNHLPYLKRLLTPKGILVADNVLFNKMVSGENRSIGKKQSIVDSLTAFIKQIFKDKDFDSSILPVGDGILLSILK